LDLDTYDQGLSEGCENPFFISGPSEVYFGAGKREKAGETFKDSEVHKKVCEEFTSRDKKFRGHMEGIYNLNLSSEFSL
jgi:hypothetical protein